MAASDDALVDRIAGGRVLDPDGRLVGTVDEVYLDDVTGELTWITVRDRRASPVFVPLLDAEFDTGVVHLPYSRADVRSAPPAGADGHLDLDLERELYDYYGIEYDDAEDEHDEHDEHDEPMVLHEERLVTSTRWQVSGRVRVSTRVVTEERTVVVPVRREELVVEHLPAAGTDRADGPAATDEPREFSILLHEEIPVVATGIRAVERARVWVETVQDEVPVTEQVRREHVELHPPGDD